MAPSLRLQVEWLVENDRDIITGPMDRTILQIEARQDLMLKTFRILFKPAQEDLDAWCELCQQTPAWGLRRVREKHLSGAKRVKARQDFLIETGSSLFSIDQMHVKAPHDFWQATHKIELRKGQTIGLVVRSIKPAVCRAMFGGE